MKLPITHLKPGMKLEKPVYGSCGELLLNRGIVLTKRYIEALRKNNVLVVEIEGPVPFDEIEIKEELSLTVRINAMQQLCSFVKKDNVSVADIKDTVEALLEEILSGKEIIDHLVDLCSADLYTFAHSVDVCMLSLLCGMKLGFNREKLLALGIGAILHDLGKTLIDPQILNKPGKLTQQEFEIIMTHPLKGWKLVEERGGDAIHPRSKKVILNHHERYDGSGYPRKLKAGEIDPFSAICAVADVYNAMTTDRVYRKAFPAHEVYEMLLASGNAKFDKDVIHAFLSCVKPYPVGTLVKLSNSKVACVVSQNDSLPFRPKVKVLPSGEILDLERELSVVIEAVLSPEEIKDLIP
ncbi:Cyclic di-GMP phosphodiesterase response regulator RpfG [Fervidicola ferrireducens]|uniref:Cyclic di-GMP phosphodiesterase response regulator RpfG n=1 Tax=Fervidicola ferrireducens TaxID=520764 RepID=A0A140LCV3_9FIRM|nr:HD-GYP domain-containing protein [Fervidicola ferrireducens]KXG78378.1 Cyclic di-GMP phosphodiesterase response regulator RpfG [Fervidicola ferrireducens]